MDALLAELTPQQFGEWMAFYAVESFGPAAEEYRAGQVCAVMANCHRDGKSKREPFAAADFFPRLRRKRKPKQQTPEEMKAAAMLWVKATEKN